MKNIRIRAIGLTLSLAIAASGMPAFAQDITVQENAQNGETLLVQDTAQEYTDVSVEQVTDEKQISDLVADNWNDDYYGEITVSTENNRAQKDGEEISFAEEMELTPEQEEEILQSPEDTAQYIDEETTLDAEVDEDGIVHITDPYQTCRLIVYANRLDSSYGAERVLYDEAAGKYTLQFATREETEAADLELTAVLGEENCVTDGVLTKSMLADTLEPMAKENYEAVSWGTKYMGFDKLKDMYDETSLSGSPVTVAVVDTGINKNHDMFKGRKVFGHSFIGKYANSRSYTTSKFTDYDGHGTHCAGIIADGTPNNVSIMGLRVFGLYKEGNKIGTMTTDSIVIEALEYAYEHGADVVNFSIGQVYDRSSPQKVYNNILKRLKNGGCVVVAAAGNKDDDNTFRRVDYPAVLSTTIAVSALKSNGRIDNTYSCYGPTIDFAAPGTAVTSAACNLNNGYMMMSGTSMAAPHVSAAAAYVKMFHPNASFSEVKEILKQNSEDLGTAGKDRHYGYGAVRMSNYFEQEKENGSLLLAKVGMQYAKMTYTGSPCLNPMTVTMERNGTPTVLSEGTDYTVSYSNHTDIGSAIATIQGIGTYTGAIACTYRIVPEQVSLVRVSNPKVRKMRVYWNPVRRGGGYQVRYAENSSFTGAKTVTLSGRKTDRYTFSKLAKGSNCYVSVRAYKTVNGKKVWGRWSAPMQISIQQ